MLGTGPRLKLQHFTFEIGKAGPELRQAIWGLLFNCAHFGHCAQTPPPTAGDQGKNGSGKDNVVDAEFVDVGH